jgi:hypothetical protein
MVSIKNYEFSAWTQTEERILIDEMLTFTGYPERLRDVHQTLQGVDTFRYKTFANGNLSQQRNFVFDSANVPSITY